MGVSLVTLHWKHVWIIWYNFRCIYWKKVLSYQRAYAEDKSRSAVLVYWWTSVRHKEGTYAIFRVQLDCMLVWGPSGTDEKLPESDIAWMFLLSHQLFSNIFTKQVIQELVNSKFFFFHLQRFINYGYPIKIENKPWFFD